MTQLCWVPVLKMVVLQHQLPIWGLPEKIQNLVTERKSQFCGLGGQYIGASVAVG